jgi:hypothetical protein
MQWTEPAGKLLVVREPARRRPGHCRQYVIPQRHSAGQVVGRLAGVGEPLGAFEGLLAGRTWRASWVGC